MSLAGSLGRFSQLAGDCGMRAVGPLLALSNLADQLLTSSEPLRRWLRQLDTPRRAAKAKEPGKNLRRSLPPGQFGGKYSYLPKHVSLI